MMAIKRFGAAGLLLVALALTGNPAHAGAMDAEIAANPALGRVAQHDPAQAAALAGDIQAALRKPGAPPPVTRGLSPLESGDRALMEENPLLSQLYIHDASAALSMLRRVKEAGGAGK